MTREKTIGKKKKKNNLLPYMGYFGWLLLTRGSMVLAIGYQRENEDMDYDL